MNMIRCNRGGFRRDRWLGREGTDRKGSEGADAGARAPAHARQGLRDRAHAARGRFPFGGKPLRELYARDYAVQSKCYAFDETTRHFWVKDSDQPYTQAPDAPFNWLRADVVGGKSLLWGRQVYRWSDLDFEANKRDGHGVDWPIRYRDSSRGTRTSSALSASAGRRRVWRSCRTANFSRRCR